MFVVLTVFLGSLYVGPLYVLGDQVHYRKIYSGLAELTLYQGYTFYTASIDSLEFVHFFLSWIASRILEKDVFVALANAFLAWVAFGVFVKWKASIYIAALLVVKLLPCGHVLFRRALEVWLHIHGVVVSLFGKSWIFLLFLVPCFDLTCSDNNSLLRVVL